MLKHFRYYILPMILSQFLIGYLVGPLIPLLERLAPSQFLIGYLNPAVDRNVPLYVNSQFLIGYLLATSPAWIALNSFSQFLIGYLKIVVDNVKLEAKDTLNSLLDTWLMGVLFAAGTLLSIPYWILAKAYIVVI